MTVDSIDAEELDLQVTEEELTAENLEFLRSVNVEQSVISIKETFVEECHLIEARYTNKDGTTWKTDVVVSKPGNLAQVASEVSKKLGIPKEAFEIEKCIAKGTVPEKKRAEIYGFDPD